MATLPLLCFLAFLLVFCKDAGEDTPSECKNASNCAEDDLQPQYSPTPTLTPTPTPSPTSPGVEQLDLQSKPVNTTFNIGSSTDIDRVEVHDQHGEEVDATIAVWPSQAGQNIYALSGVKATSDFFFLADAVNKDIDTIVGFKGSRKIFSAQVQVIANADTNITMLTHLFSESGAGTGPYSARFSFSKHPEKGTFASPKLEQDKPLEFIAIDDEGNTLWLVNTHDKQDVRIAVVSILIENDIHISYRLIRKACQLQQLVFARLENKIFQATCQDQLKRSEAAAASK